MDLKYAVSHMFPNDTRISWRTSLFNTIWPNKMFHIIEMTCTVDAYVYKIIAEGLREGPSVAKPQSLMRCPNILAYIVLSSKTLGETVQTSTHQQERVD